MGVFPWSNRPLLVCTITLLCALLYLSRSFDSIDSYDPAELTTSLTTKISSTGSSLMRGSGHSRGSSSHSADAINDGQPRWLLAILLPPSKISRRAAIRATWASRFPNPNYECRFILGSYKDTIWAPVVEHENATYGDIIELDWMPDNADTANHIKASVLYDYLQRQYRATGRKYDFVSKVDDDNWLNVPVFYNTFIAPRLPGGPKYDPEALTVIGRPFNYNYPWTYTSGRMYTVNWNVLTFLADKFMEDPSRNFEDSHLAEDMVPIYFLYTDQIQIDFVPVEMHQAWDIGLEGVVNAETIEIHCIKTDERILQLNTLFDDNAHWNGVLMNGVTNFNRCSEETLKRMGEVKDPEEMRLIEQGWKSWTSHSIVNGVHIDDPFATLDWKYISRDITIEDRVRMGTLYPLNLTASNNESTPTVR